MDKLTQQLTDAGCRFACRRLTARTVEVKVAGTLTLDDTTAEFRKLYAAVKANGLRIVGALAIGVVVACK